MAQMLTARSIETTSTRPPSGARSPTGTCQGSTSSYSRREPSPGRSATGMPAGPGSILSAPTPPSTSRRPAISPARRCAPWPRAAIPAARSGRRRPDTVEAIARQFIERHCRRSNRPHTAAETQRLIDRHVLPRWRGRLARDITRRDILDLLDRVVDAGTPITANRTSGGGTEDVQLGGRPRHPPLFPLRGGKTADSGTRPRPGADRS